MSPAAIGPRDAAWLAPVTWPVQPSDATYALAIAAALALAGAIVHMRRGAASTVSAVE